MACAIRKRAFVASAALVFGTALFGARPAAAGGGLLYEVGTADVGLAAAGYGARAQDAATVLTNPAGMTRLEGTQILAGLQALYANLEFERTPATSPALGSEDGGNPIGWLPGGGTFLTHQASPKLSLGLGAAGNFGLAEEYEDGWVGRYYVEKTVLLGISFLPSVAYRISDQVSAGVSLNAVYSVFNNQVAINNITGPDGRLDLDDTAWGGGVNFGLLYDNGGSTRAGLVYTSQVTLGFESRAEFSNLSSGLSAVLGTVGLLDADVSLAMRIPQTVMLSSFHQVKPNLALLTSVGWQEWSKFDRVEVGVNSADPVDLTASTPFKDTWHGAIGLQDQVSEAWRIDLGVGYDSGFQEDGKISPAMPANEALRIGAGVKHQTSPGFGWGLAAEYSYGGTLEVYRESDAPVLVGGRGDLIGSYENTSIAFLAGNVEWRF